MQINFQKIGFKRQYPLGAAVLHTAAKSPSLWEGAWAGAVWVSFDKE
jgi:hypothetical protein